MTVLATIGMIALLLLGCIFIIVGLQMAFVAAAFTGSFQFLGLLPLIIGGLLIWAACALSPWSIVLKVTAS